MSEVILVDANDAPIGEMEKMEAHRLGVLHRAFSIFIFNKKGEMLLQRRAPNKYHNGGLWSNSCCSHPIPGEDTLAAAEKRLKEEMGFTTSLTKIFDFKYKTLFDNGLTEHEFDHVFVGEYDGQIIPNYNEISDYTFLSLDEISASIEANPEKFTSWFKIAFEKVVSYRSELIVIA
ncbi:MAG: isopentenyl-diphosphate Delta-isomerase [Ginsengibacter sp.]